MRVVRIRTAVAVMVISLVAGLVALAPDAEAAGVVTHQSANAVSNSQDQPFTIHGTGFSDLSTVELIEVAPAPTSEVERTIPAKVVARRVSDLNPAWTAIDVTLPTKARAPSNASSTPSSDVSWFVQVTTGSDKARSAELQIVGDQVAVDGGKGTYEVFANATTTVTLTGAAFAERATVEILAEKADGGVPEQPAFGVQVTIDNPAENYLSKLRISVNVPRSYPTGDYFIRVKNTNGLVAMCECLKISAARSVTVPKPTKIDPPVGSNTSSSDLPVTIEGTSFLSEATAELIGYCPSGAPNCPMASVPRVAMDRIEVVQARDEAIENDKWKGKVNLEDVAPGRYSVRITNPDSVGSQGTLAGAFDVVAPPPSVKSISPTSIPAGKTTEVTIQGTGLRPADSRVSIAGSSADVLKAKSTPTALVVAVTPAANAATGPRDVTVRNTDGAGSTCANCLTVTAAPTPPGNPTTKDERYIDAAHKLFLGRAATKADLDRWRTTIARGDRLALTKNLAASDEFAGKQIDALYRKILGRPVEANGRRYWVGQVQKGLRIEQIAVELYGSDEFFRRVGSTNRNYVDALYSMILRRSGDTDGRAYWTRQLDERRLTRSQVAAGFYDGIESRRQRVTAQYVLVLGRTPDPAGRDHWAEQIRRLGDVVLAATLAASDEYYLRVTR